MCTGTKIIVFENPLWAKIAVDECQKIISFCVGRCATVIKNNSLSSKY